MNWLRNMLGSDPRLWALVKQQHECIQAWQIEYRRQDARYSEALRDLIIEIRTALDTADHDDLCERLDSAICDLRDQTARNSEHAL